MTFFVGLAGPAKVGKSTTANELLRLLKLKNTNLLISTEAFADPIYDICEYITGIKKNILMDQKFKEIPWNKENAPLPCLIGWTPRKLLQIIGTEGIRNNISSDFWIHLTINKHENKDIVIMSDARFDNEFKYCNFVIELNREGIDYAENHPSAMKPHPSLIDYKLTLYPNIDLTTISELILNLYKGEENAKQIVG